MEVWQLPELHEMEMVDSLLTKVDILLADTLYNVRSKEGNENSVYELLIT